MTTPRFDPESWSRVESVFHEASERPEAERSEFLDRATDGDSALRAAVERLLAHDRTDGSPLDRPIEAIAAPLLGGASGPDVPLAAGTRVGPYRILGEIGTGGMGRVYRAERADGAYQREVAIKVVRTGRLNEDAERRFALERQILGRLKHPGIATLVDGGITGDGAAFLAMELVEGRVITEYARERALDVASRVRLVVSVAEAVEYAHRNLVVHRDLKPSNILVEKDGTPKLLDFGIARLLDEETAEPLTATGLFLLTPDYAAPEQIRGESITTQTDVYAVGAILHELLTGERPFGRVSATWSDLERVLDAERPRPSEAPSLTAAERRAIQGDLDTIIRKALHKDPERRYRSARALAEDLERYLEGRPVQARPDSLGYRASKFLQRNRAGSIAAILVLMVGAIGLAGTLWGARQARVEAERGRAVGDFLFSLFEAADPDRNPGTPVTALSLLEAGVARVDSFSAGPEARVDLLTTLGLLFDKLGHYERAGALLEQAVEESRSGLPAGDPAVGRALDAHGVLLSRLGNLEQAERTLSEALDSRIRSGASPEEIATTESNLAAALRNNGRYDEARERYRAAIGRRLAAGADSAALTSELIGLAQIHQFEDRLEEAEALFRSVLRLQGGAEQPVVAHATHNLGVLLADQSRFEEAEEVHRDALGMWRRLFPNGHPEIARTFEALGRVVARQGRLAEADSLYRQAIDGWSALYGSQHTQIATIHANRANLRYAEGNFGEAAAAYRDGIAIWRANGERRLLGAALRNLGIIERERGNLTAADSLLAAALELRRELHGDVHTSVAETHSAIAGLRVRQGRFDEAERHARLAVGQYGELLEPGHFLTFNANFELGVAVAHQGRCEEARSILTPVAEEYVRVRDETDVPRARAHLWLGICLAALGEPDSARVLIRAARPHLVAGLPSDHPDRRRAEREVIPPDR